MQIGNAMEVEISERELAEEIMIQDEAFERFQALCSDLNLDSTTKDATWRTFNNVRNKYTLEGEPAHWLCCAVYVACRQANIPSVNSAAVHGNYVNLTRLLRTSQLSLTDFFDKSRKWGDMTNMHQEFRSKIERLERNFAVTTCIFKKFDPIFGGVFKDFSRRELDDSKPKRRSSPKSALDLFEFCWTLFLCVKSSLRISDDLVNSYHLLLACADLVYHNVVNAGRKNLLTPKFAELADSVTDPPGEPVCTIHTLCELYDGISVEAKTIKEFWLKPKIRNMIESGSLKGDSETLTGLIDETVFEHNFKRMEKEYEEFVLTEGDFDERLYLSRSGGFSDEQLDAQMEHLKSIERQTVEYKAFPPLQELRHLMPQTPLSGKKYMPDKDDNFTSPISAATQNVSRLQALLSNRKAEPSAALTDIVVGCSEELVQNIKERAQKYGELFMSGYSKKFDNQPGLHSEFAYFRCQNGLTLYYALLESVLTAESKLRPDKGELGEILREENFHVSLLACSFEIVLFSYNSQRKFPWILEVFELPGYHFYKVVEVVVRAEANLSRDVVKHLSQVEERVLEELAWKSNSPLWDSISAIVASEDPVPSCDEVFLPSQIEKGDNATNGDAPKRYAVIKTPAGEKCVPVAVGGTNQSTLIIQDKTSSQILGVVLPSKHGDKPKRGNSVALFFRKFYHLSYVRLQDLCKNLNVDNELLRKIWTSFQNAIVNHVEELMKSRHLDQILMCCIYVVSKVTGNEKTFTEIMRCYRLQPQSASHVYRSVPLSREDERGDLIKFYNSIFIGKMQKYALRFSSKTEEANNVPLSPVPHLTPSALSPKRKVSSKHSIFLSSLKSTKSPSPAKHLRYNFSRSPSTNLKAINAIIAENKPKAVKRILGDDPMEGPQSKVFARRLQEFIDESKSLE